MKRTLIAVLLLLVSYAATAANSGTVLAQVNLGNLENYTLEFGAEASYIKYEEPDVMEEEGSMYGITGAYTFSPEHYDYILRFEGKASWGEVDYENSGTLEGVDDYMLEFRGYYGYNFPVFTATTLTPYIGFGYRYLNDDLTGTTSTGALGYERESNYFYSPIGIEMVTELDYAWTIGFIIEYDYFWKGIQKSHLSDANPLFNDLENDQNDGYGVRGSVKIEKKSESLDLLIEPFIRYWNIKKSEEDAITFAGVVFGYGYEPKNNSIEIGGRVAVIF